MLKYLIKVMGLAVLVWMLAVTAVVTFINPTKFKQALEAQLHQETGQILRVAGSIHWRFFPGLCLEVQNVTLKSTDPFLQDFMAIQQVQFFPKVGAFLFGKFLFDVKASIVTVNLIRLSSGINNWESLLNHLKKIQHKGFLATRFTIENGQIYFQDNLENRHYTMEDLTFSMDPLIKALNSRGSQLNLAFTAKNEQQSVVKLHFKTTLKQPNAEKMELNDCELQAAVDHQPPVTLSGSLKISDVKRSPKIEGILEAKALDCHLWLKPFLGSMIILPTIENLNIQFSYRDQQIEIPAFMAKTREHGTLEGHLKFNSVFDPRKLQGQGNLFGKTLKIGSFDLQQFKTQITLNESVLNLANIGFQFANGKHESSLQVDYRGHEPKFDLVYQGENFDIQTLLKIVDQATLIEGKTQFKTKLSTFGTAVEQWRQNLKGQAEIQISRGNLYGADLLFLLKHAQSTVKSLLFDMQRKQPIDLPKTLKSEREEWKKQAEAKYQFLTPFETAKATALISNGLLNSPDLSIQHPKYSIEGQGDFDIAKAVLQFQTMVHYKEAPLNVSQALALILQETPLKIQIKGDLQNPMIKPDLEGYTQFPLQFSQKNPSEEVIHKTMEEES